MLHWGTISFTIAVLAFGPQTASAQAVPGYDAAYEERLSPGVHTEYASPGSVPSLVSSELMRSSTSSSVDMMGDLTEATVTRRFSEHHSGVFGEFLYLTARDVDQPYATPVDGPIASAVPIGPTSVVEPNYKPGFRIGGTYSINWWSSLTATFSWYRSSSGDSLSLPGGTGWIRPEVTHPDVMATDFDKLNSRAEYDIEFQTTDLAYRALLANGCNHAINWSIGLRYGYLDQQFHADYRVVGETTVDTEIGFHGLGVVAGLEGERSLNFGLLVYGRGLGSLLAGEFKADYLQQSIMAGPEATASIDDRRIVPQLDLECGIGWQDSSARFRVRAGYSLGMWFNVATTPTWIDAVQTSNALDVSESIVFHGLVLRAEYRF